MQQFRADLHIHTVLSPCGSLEMSPGNIVRSALNIGLDIIAITDHNSTRQVSAVKRLAEKEGLTVIGGAEINTSEEVHCLALFENDEQLGEFQYFIDRNMPVYFNDPKRFGEQVIVDEFENIIYEEPRLLIAGLNCGIFEVEKMVHSLNGLFIPAHIDRLYNGIISQLGFIPEELICDAFGLTRRAVLSDWETSSKLPVNHVFLRNSDAHRPEDIGRQSSVFEMEKISFQEMKLALKGEGGRRVVVR